MALITCGEYEKKSSTKASLFVLAVLISNTAFGQLVPIQTVNDADGTHSEFFDSSQTSRSPDNRYVTTMLVDNYANPAKLDASHFYSSITTKANYDCSKRLVRYRGEIIYAGTFATGNVVQKTDSAWSAWVSPVQGAPQTQLSTLCAYSTQPSDTAQSNANAATTAPSAREDAELALSRVRRAGFKCEGKYDFFKRELVDSIVCSGKQYNISVYGDDVTVWTQPGIFSNSVTRTIPLENELREKRDRENSEKFAASNEYEAKQREKASHIIPFEDHAAMTIPSWENRIDAVRAVTAIKNHQVRCDSIFAIIYNGSGSAKVVCDQSAYIYRVDFVQNRAYVYIEYSRD